MKIKFYDRLLLAVFGLIGIALAAVIGALFYFRDNVRLTFGRFALFLDNTVLSYAIMIVLIVILVGWSIRLLILAFKREPKVDKSSVSVQNTENGSVRISVQAMDMLVKQAIGKVDGVVDIKTNIINHEDSITVKVDMTIDSDVHIPNVTLIMQRQIKSFIEEYSGIAVREVTILVSKIVEVQPQPPLQISEPLKREPEIIDQPAALEPEVELQTPETVADEPEPVVDETGTEEAEPEAEATEPEHEETDKAANEHISEKDFW